MKIDVNKIDIDLVYLWVDGNAPKWQAKKKAFTGKTDENSDINCKGRFFDNDELKYSLRSVEKYAPWIRNIFIVTDEQTPKWLNTENPKIKIVDHKEILPPQSLPCFNSSVILHFLCKIPGLSEHFLYADDDMFFNKNVTKSTFFTANGLPIFRLCFRPFRKLTLLFKGKKVSTYNRRIQNAAKLVEKKYGKYYNGKPHHNIDSYLKSTCLHTIEQVFKEEIEATLSNHLRTENDIQRSLYSYVALAQKQGYLKHSTKKFAFHFHIDNNNHYTKLKKYNPTLFCMNDSQYANDEDRIKAKEFLENRFPEKSQFEK